jgi:hypothetical protein
MVFVNHYANAATALVFKAADHAAMAVNLDIATRTHDIARKQNRKVYGGAYWNVFIHREEHAVGGNVLRFRRAGMALRLQLHRQMQRKSRSTLHFGIVLDRGFRLGIYRQLFLCSFA